MISFLYVTYKHNLTVYADDTLLIEYGASIEVSVKVSQSCLNEVIHWCTLNKLTVNICKNDSSWVKKSW